MPDESRYFDALEAAQAIIKELNARPGLPPHERLAAVTFTILRAMHKADGMAKDGHTCCVPPALPVPAEACRGVAAVGITLLD
jgi:hypothetical protein